MKGAFARWWRFNVHGGPSSGLLPAVDVPCSSNDPAGRRWPNRPDEGNLRAHPSVFCPLTRPSPTATCFLNAKLRRGRGRRQRGIDVLTTNERMHPACSSFTDRLLSVSSVFQAPLPKWLNRWDLEQASQESKRTRCGAGRVHGSGIRTVQSFMSRRAASVSWLFNSRPDKRDATRTHDAHQTSEEHGRIMKERSPAQEPASMTEAVALGGFALESTLVNVCREASPTNRDGPDG